jgi:hypothetical protein
MVSGFFWREHPRLTSQLCLLSASTFSTFQLLHSFSRLPTCNRSPFPGTTKIYYACPGVFDSWTCFLRNVTVYPAQRYDDEAKYVLVPGRTNTGNTRTSAHPMNVYPRARERESEQASAMMTCSPCGATPGIPRETIKLPAMFQMVHSRRFRS